MVYKYLILPAALCAALLLNANAAQAQHGGGHGGGGGGHGGGGHAGGGAYHGGGGAYYGGGGAYHGGGGAYHGGGAYYRNGRYYYGYGIGLGVGSYYGGYGYPYYYDDYYPVAVPRVSYYPAPVVVGQLPPSDPLPAVGATAAANVRVLVPDGQAKVWFDGTLTTQAGTDRYYHTPSLSGAGPFSYRIRAAWIVNGKEVAREALAQVSPGQTSTVDFTRPASEPLPAPKQD